MSGEAEMARREPLEMRASDSERRRVVATLQAACVEGRLTLDEYGQRVEAALGARTRAQLEPLTADLPTDADSTRALGPDLGTSGWCGASVGGLGRAATQVSSTVAVLGMAQRSGAWRLAEASRVVAVLGNCRVDLRSARISAPVTTIEVGALMGAVDLIVPTGVEIEIEVHAVLGSRDMRVAGAAPAPGAPVIRITGAVLLGALNVRDAVAYQAHIDAYR